VEETKISAPNLNPLKCVGLTIVALRVGSTEIDAKDIAPSGAPDDVASLSGLGGREATMSEAAGGTVRVVREMSAASMLKGVDSRIDEASLDGRGLGELDCSHERQQYSHESANTKLGVAGTSNKGVRTKPRVEESVRKDDRSTVGPGIRKKGPKCT
jgi:hypothetical protein